MKPTLKKFAREFTTTRNLVSLAAGVAAGAALYSFAALPTYTMTVTAGPVVMAVALGVAVWLITSSIWSVSTDKSNEKKPKTTEVREDITIKDGNRSQEVHRETTVHTDLKDAAATPTVPV